MASKARKAKVAPKKPATGKRKRTESVDNPTQTKRVRISKPDSSRTPRTRAIKKETQECDICAETKPVYRDFPLLPTCTHEATVCVSCFERHFITKIDENREQGWSACTCPLCGEQANEVDAQGVLPRQVSKDLCTMIENIRKQSAQNWVWCPGVGCGHGQLHKVGSNNKITCKFCRFKNCYRHQGKWHEGFTCDEFDQLGDHDANTARSIAEIQRTTKPCPHCKARIKKEGGCNHMYCTGCKKQWLWDTVPFDGENVATAAEARGGPSRSRVLQGEARQVVEQVIRFENARVDNRQAIMPIQAGVHQAHPILQPLRDILVNTVRHVNTAWRRFSPIRQWEPQPGPGREDVVGRHPPEQPHHRDNGNAPAILTGEPTDVVRQGHFAASPVSNVRSTQNVVPRPRPSPRQPRARAQGQTQARTSSRAATTLPLVVLDDSDVENAIIERRTGRQIERRLARIDQMMSGPTEVIDLTGDDDNIIDLTEDD